MKWTKRRSCAWAVASATCAPCRQVNLHAEIVAPEADKARLESRCTERTLLHPEFLSCSSIVYKPAKANTFTVSIRWGSVFWGNRRSWIDQSERNWRRATN